MSPAHRFWTVALGAGAISAAMYLIAAQSPFGGGLLLYFAQLPLFVAGLTFGAAASAVAGAAAAGALMYQHDYLVALVFAVMFIIPVPVLVRQALLSRQGPDGQVEWYPPGLLAGWLLAIGVGMLLAAGAWLAAHGSVEEAAVQVASKMMDLLAQITQQPAPTPEAKMRGAENLGGILLGTMAATLLVITVINGALAQSLAKRFGWNRRPSPDMAALDLPWHVPALFTAALVLGSMLPGDLGFMVRNLVPIMLLGGVLSGLAVVHAAVRRLEGKAWMLAIVYAICGFMVLPMFLLAAIGLAEPFVKLRRRMSAA